MSLKYDRKWDDEIKWNEKFHNGNWAYNLLIITLKEVSFSFMIWFFFNLVVHMLMDLPNSNTIYIFE